MTSSPSPETDRRRGQLDWRALAIVVALHALLVVWLSRPRGELPALPSSTAMVLVNLIDTTIPSTVHELRSSLNSAAALGVKHRVKDPAPESRVSERVPPSQQRLGADSVIPEGHEALGVSSAAPAITSAPSPSGLSSVAGNGSVGLLSKIGTGTYAGPRFRPPRVQHRFTPDYPSDAFHAHQQGSVDVIVDVPDSGGLASEAHVYQSSGTQSLDAAAVAAVRKWTFRGAERNGNPTRAQAIVTIDWIIGPNTREHVALPGTDAATPSRVDVMRQLDCLRTQIGSSPELCKRVPKR